MFIRQVATFAYNNLKISKFYPIDDTPPPQSIRIFTLTSKLQKTIFFKLLKSKRNE